jgi:hypothetical protein
VVSSSTERGQVQRSQYAEESTQIADALSYVSEKDGSGVEDGVPADRLTAAKECEEG